MKLPRRQFLHLAAGAAALPAVSRIARAQNYPTRPVRLVVGFPPGGPADIVARLMGQWLSERLGQPFVVENRPGAAGNIATELVVRAIPDGHTLLVAISANVTNATLYNNLKFDFIQDIVPIAGATTVGGVVAVNPTFPSKTLPQLIAYAKANPGKINVGSGGIGTSGHLFGEMFRMMTDTDVVHVPYRGDALALTGLLAGQVQVMFPLMPTSIEHVRAGKLLALAVTTSARAPQLPDVPTVGEFLPGYRASVWNGVGAPKGTPDEIVGKLNREINAGLADPKINAQIINLGADVLGGSPADFGKLIADETEKWAKVIKFANIKPD